MPWVVGGKLVTWKDFVKQNGLQFKDGFSLGTWSQQLGDKWPKDVYSPSNGIVDRTVLTLLTKALSKFSGKDANHFFYFDAMKIENHEQVEFFSGKLDDVLSFQNESRVTMTPTYWFPESKKWRVYSNEELWWSYITGSKDFISALLINDELECVELSALD